MKKNDITGNTQKLQSYIDVQHIGLQFSGGTLVRGYLPVSADYVDGVIRSVFENKLDFGFGETTLIFPRMVDNILLMDLNYYRFFEVYCKLYEYYRQGREGWFYHGMIGLTQLFMACVFRNQMWFSDELLNGFYEAHLPSLSQEPTKSIQDSLEINLSSNVMLTMFHELGHLMLKRPHYDKANSFLVQETMETLLSMVFNPEEMERIKKYEEDSLNESPTYKVLMNAQVNGIPPVVKTEMWCDIFSFRFLFSSGKTLNPDEFTARLEGMIIGNLFLDHMNRLVQSTKAMLDAKTSEADLEKVNLRFDLLRHLRNAAFYYTGFVMNGGKHNHREYLDEAINRTAEFEQTLKAVYIQATDAVCVALDKATEVKNSYSSYGDEAGIMKMRFIGRQQDAFQKFYNTDRSF